MNDALLGRDAPPLVERKPEPRDVAPLMKEYL